MKDQLAIFILFDSKTLGIAGELAVEFFDHVVDGHFNRRQGVDV